MDLQLTIRWIVCLLLFLAIFPLLLSAYTIFSDIKATVIRSRGEREDDYNRWSGAFIQEYKQLFLDRKPLIRLNVFQTLLFIDLAVIAGLVVFR